MIYKRLIALIIGAIIFNPLLQAQILTRTISKFDSLSNLTYKMTIRSKHPMSENVSNDTLTASFTFLKNQKLFNVVGRSEQEVYDGNNLIKIDLNNHTYSITKGVRGSMVQHRMLPYIIDELKKDLVRNAPIILHDDSIVNGIKCFHLKIASRDTIIKNNRIYLIREVLLDRQSYLPIYYKFEQQGFVDGTDILVNAYAEMYFYDYHLNQENFANISEFKIPSKFIIESPQERKPALTKGTKAPELHLTDKNGNVFQLAKQKGTVVLLNFTMNKCAHGAEAISMLNNLYSKYGKKNLAIVTVNPYDDKEAIEIYNKKARVKYPIYIGNDITNNTNYNVYDLPTFYLIDKNGKVIQAFTGYFETTEKQLDNLIKQYL